MGVIRYKIWRDLWENKGRTWRVIAIIAIGAFAVGAVLGGKEFIRQDVTRAWQASHPATIGLEVNPPVDDALIESLENLQEIEIVEGWFQDKTVRWRRSPYDPWQPALLVALADYEDQTIRQVTLDSGDWPQRKLMGVQRGRGLEVGDQVELQLDNQVYPVELNGVLYNAVHPSPMMLPGPMFFTTRERFTQLTGQTGSSLVLATIPHYSDTGVKAAADLLQHELEKQDMAVMTAVVGAVALSGTLAINVLERTREIRVMRAIGASTWVVAGQFIGEGLILGWLSWLLAIPLSLPTGWLLSQALARNLHIELVYQFSAWGVGYWFLIITVLAVIASWFPAQKAAQTSVRESLAYI